MVASSRIRNFWGFFNSSTAQEESQALYDLLVELPAPRVLPVLDIEQRQHEEQGANDKERIRRERRERHERTRNHTKEDVQREVSLGGV